MDEIIKKSLWNIIRYDVEQYSNIDHDKGYFSVEENGQWSYKTEILMLTIKSLMPLEESVAININEERFLHELQLWQYYRHGSNEELIDLVRNQSKDYWSLKDDTLIIRILLLAIVNNDKNLLKDLVIKHTLFITGNLEILFENLTISLMVHYWILNKGNIEDERLSSLIKEDMMLLSKKNYIEKYKKYYKKNIENFNGHFDIAFERQKIAYLSKIDRWLEPDGLKETHEIIWLFYQKGLKENYELKIKEESIKDEVIIESLFDYILKLKKGRVAPISLKIQNYKKLDPFEFEEDQKIEHSLLKNAIVIRRGENEKYIKMIVQTKMGNLRFFKIKNSGFDI